MSWDNLRANGHSRKFLQLVGEVCAVERREVAVAREVHETDVAQGCDKTVIGNESDL